jgi:hypothetical protein
MRTARDPDPREDARGGDHVLKKKHIQFEPNTGEVTIFLPPEKEHLREQLWEDFADRFSYESGDSRTIEEMDRFVADWLQSNPLSQRLP